MTVTATVEELSRFEGRCLGWAESRAEFVSTNVIQFVREAIKRPKDEEIAERKADAAREFDEKNPRPVLLPKV